MPFLVALTPEDRRSLLHLGERSEAFVRRAQYMANRHPGILSQDFGLEEKLRHRPLLRPAGYSAGGDAFH